MILRFNIGAFRNSYTLTDLTKMDLVYYGIRVGECSLKDLLLENEFPKEEETKKLTAEEIYNEKIINQTEKNLKIFDVLLAGVVGDKDES